VSLELQDGGFGDADGTENGVIIDPSGLDLVDTIPSNPPQPSADEGGGCFITTTAFQ
jgi:hypothetical protein